MVHLWPYQSGGCDMEDTGKKVVLDVKDMRGYEFTGYEVLKIRFPTGTLNVHINSGHSHPAAHLLCWFSEPDGRGTCYHDDMHEPVELISDIINELKVKQKFMLDLCDQLLDGDKLAFVIRREL